MSVAGSNGPSSGRLQVPGGGEAVRSRGSNAASASSSPMASRPTSAPRGTSSTAAANLLAMALSTRGPASPASPPFARAHSLLTPTAAPVHSSSARVVSHLEAVRSAILAQVHGDPLDDDDASGEAAASRLQREDASKRAPENPMLSLPGRQMMAASKALSNASFQEATSAALLSMSLKRRNEPAEIAAAASLEPPSVARMIARQEWARGVIRDRWMSVREEVAAAQSADADLAALLLGARTTPDAAAAATAITTTAPTAVTPADPAAAAPATSTSTPARRSASTSKRTSALNSPTTSARASRLSSAARLRSAGGEKDAAPSSPALERALVDAGAAAHTVDPDFDPVWDEGEGSTVFRAWFRSELRALKTPYDTYLARTTAAAAAEADRAAHGPRALDRYAVGHRAAGEDAPHPLHSRALAVRREWAARVPPVLRERFDQVGLSEAARRAAENPVLVPVIERRLMDLSKSREEILAQIERDERGLIGGGGSGAPHSTGAVDDAGRDAETVVARVTGTELVPVSTGEEKTAQADAAPRPASPRAVYDAAQSLTLANLVSLLMKLDEPALRAMRAEFAQYSGRGGAGGGLVLYDFVLAACTHIARCEAEETDLRSLVEMFDEVDVNGDRLMEWDEFTTHLVQLASTYGSDAASPEAAPHFVPVGLASHEDTELHSRPCEVVRWCGGSGLPGVRGLHRLLLIERNSRLLKVYNTELTCVQTLRARAPILAVEYLPPRGQVVVACADRTLQFFSCRRSASVDADAGVPAAGWTLEATWHLPASQTCLEYAGKNVYTLDGLSSPASKVPRGGGGGAGGGQGSVASVVVGGGASTASAGGRASRAASRDDEFATGGGGSSASLNFTLLYTGDTSGRITCWNLDRGEERFRIERAHSDVVMSMRLLTPLGPGKLATVGLDGAVKVFDCARVAAAASASSASKPTATVTTGATTPSHTLVGHTKPPLHIAFHPDLHLLVTGGLDPFALVWANPFASGSGAAGAKGVAKSGASGGGAGGSTASASTGPLLRLAVLTPQAHVVGIEVLLGSPEVVIGDSGGGFQVYDLRTGALVQSFAAPRSVRTLAAQQAAGPGGGVHAATVNSLCVVPSSGLLVAAGPKLFSFRRTTGVQATRADDDPIQACFWDAHALVFVTASASNLKIWNGLTGALTREEKGFMASAAAGGGRGGLASLLALGSGAEDVASLPTITSACMDERFRRVYLGLSNGVVISVNINTGAVLGRLAVAPRGCEVSALLHHATTKQVVCGSSDGGVCFVDDLLTSVARRVARGEHAKDVVSLAAAPEARLVASLAADSTLCLFDDRQGPPLAKWTLDAAPTAMTFLSPYPLLAVADEHGGLTFFDTHAPLAGGAPLLKLDQLNALPRSRPSSPRGNKNSSTAAATAATPEEIERARVNLADVEEARARAATEAARRAAKDAVVAAAVENLAKSRPGSAVAARHAAQALADEALERGRERAPSAVRRKKQATAAGGATLHASLLLDGDTPSASSSTANSGAKAPRKHPAILYLRFEPVHRHLLIADEAGYIKVLPLGFALLRIFHSAEVAHPSTPFLADVFRPVRETLLAAATASNTGTDTEKLVEDDEAAGGRVVRNGFSAPVVAAQPRVLTPSGGPGEKKRLSVVARLEKMALAAGSSQQPHLRRPSVTPAAAANKSTTVAATAATSEIDPSLAGLAAIPSAPPPPPVMYAPASLSYPPAPTRSTIDAGLIKTWSESDASHARTHLRVSLAIQAHRDAAHGVDLVLDTLFEATLVSWSFDGGVRLWNASNGERVGALMQGHNARTATREEPWAFYFDLAKHRARAAQMHAEAFERPPSPEPDEEEEEDLARVARIAPPQTAAVTHQLPAPTGAPQMHALLPPREEEEKDSEEPDESLRAQRVARGDTFLTDLDGEASSSKKKKKKHRHTTGDIILSPSAASDAAARLTQRSQRSHREGEPHSGEERVASDRRGSRARSKPGSASSLARVSEHPGPTHPHSTSGTPIASPMPRRPVGGLAYSYSQPVLSVASGVASTTSTDPSSPLVANSPAIDRSGEASGASSPKPVVAFRTSSAGRSPGVGPSPSPTLVPVVDLPRRTAPWRGLPGVGGIAPKPLVSAVAPPLASATRGNASTAQARDADHRATSKSQLRMLAQLSASPPDLLRPVGEPRALTASASASSLLGAAGSSPSIGSHSLVQLETRTLPLPSQLRGPPRLGRDRLTLHRNPVTGRMEPDPEEVRALAEREEIEKHRRSWWKPTDPRLKRAPRVILPVETKRKKKKQNDDPAAEPEPEEEDGRPQQVHKLWVHKSALELNPRQALSVTLLGDRVRAAQATIDADVDRGLNIPYLEKRQREHAAQMSEF